MPRTKMQTNIILRGSYCDARHPNILLCLGAHLQAGSCYIVLELMKCDLFSALSNPEWSQVLSWGERCVQAAGRPDSGLSWA